MGCIYNGLNEKFPLKTPSYTLTPQSFSPALLVTIPYWIYTENIHEISNIFHLPFIDL